MLFPHVVDLQSGQGAIGQRPLDGLSGVIGVDMDLYQTVVRYQHNGVSDGLQEMP